MSISDVLEEYEKIRAKNNLEEKRREREALNKIPKLGDIFLKIKDLQQKRIFNALSGDNDYSTQIKALRKNARDLLINAGLPSNYLDPIYSCSICSDTGLLNNGERCNCFKKRALKDKLNDAGLTDINVSFERFDLQIFDDTPIDKGKSQRDEMQNYKQRTEAYADNFPDCPLILVLSGAIGLGKTYIAKCIMHRIIERGYPAAFYTAYKLFSLFHKDRLGEEVDLSPLFEVPLLIIDDIGTEPMTRNVTVEYFFNLLNERCSADLHTVIITNFALHELKTHYGERIHSRLLDTKTSQKIIFKGKDIRVPSKS